jgi:outer membrane protein OmpA-like peptidoglycan-associated protein
MKRQTRILAGTAIGLLMASTPLLAAPAMNLTRPHENRATAGAPLILAQGQNQDEDQERKKKKGEKAGRKDPDAEQAAPKQAQPKAQAAPKAEAAPKPEAKPERQAAEPRPEPKPKAESEAKPERKPKREQAAEPQAAPEAAPKPAPKAAEQAPEAKPAPKAVEKAREPKPEKRAAEPDAKAAPKAAEEAAKPQRPAKAAEPKPAREASEPKPAQDAVEPKPAQEAAEPETQKPFKAENDNQKQPATAEGRKDKLRKYLKNKGQDPENTGDQNAGDQNTGHENAGEEPKAEQPKQAEQPKAEQPEQTAKPGKEATPEGQPGEKQPAEKQAKPSGEQPPANGNQQAGDGEQKPTKTVLPGNLKGGKERRQERVKEQADAQPLPDNAAPVFDSNKRGPGADGRKKGERNGQEGKDQARGDRQRRQEEQATGDAPPPPRSDSAAQQVRFGADVIRSLLGGDREGERFEPRSREERHEFQRRRHERRDNADVVKVYNDNRTIIEVNNRIYVDSSDSDRLVRRDDRVYYDELPRGRTREVVARRNGVQVVTIRNRYGDVIRRSRVMPDGREVVLVYVPDDQIRQDGEWYDPARDLPPLRLTVPVSSYILEAATVEEPELYYEFFEQPPVAPIERIYSVEDVKRSARVRDIMPRVDLDTITFETGSAEIAESEVDELDGIAQAILKVLEDNPGETFLIEGHTDAVGSEESNLVLSDRRAAAVADALASVYEIPPENLVTQGYGEEYLKIDSGDAERANRRVAMRRITPLVAPVASAE